MRGTSRRTLLVLSVGLGMLAGCGRSEGDAAGGDGGPSEDDLVKVVNVGISYVQPTVFEEYIRLAGVVKAERDALLSAEETGVIRSFLREKGTEVSEGDSLAQIDDRLLRAAVAEATADSSLAAEQYGRQRRLWEEEGIGSEIAYLEARHRAEQATARVEGLRTRLDNTVIRAPFGGVFDERFVDVGEMVAPGTPVARVIDTGTLEVEAGVPERFAGDVRVGSRAYVSFDVLPEREFAGEVSFVGGTVDPGNRTFPIEIKMGGGQEALKPEMVADIRVVRNHLEGAVVIPQEAVRRTEDGYVVFVVDGGSGEAVAEVRDVRLGPSYANRVVVEEGLRAGERLITTGQHMVVTGSRVRVVAEAEGEGS